MRQTRLPSAIAFSAICGMAAPIIFAITVIFIGLLTPGYNPITQLISELGITDEPYATAFNGVGFVLVGILLGSFAYSVYKMFKQGWMIVFGSGMVVLTGLSFIAMGFFHCDQGCVPISQSGNLHLLLGEIAIIAGMLGALIFSVIMYRENEWDGYWQYSLLTGILVLVMLPIFTSLKDIAGILQRILVAIIFLWTEVIAIRIFLLNVYKEWPSKRNE